MGVLRLPVVQTFPLLVKILLPAFISLSLAAALPGAPLADTNHRDGPLPMDGASFPREAPHEGSASPHLFDLETDLAKGIQLTSATLPLEMPARPSLNSPLVLFNTGDSGGGIENIPTLTAKTLSALELQLTDASRTARLGNLTFTSIPEPGAWLLIGLGTAFVLWRRKKGASF